MIGQSTFLLVYLGLVSAVIGGAIALLAGFLTARLWRRRRASDLSLVVDAAIGCVTPFIVLVIVWLFPAYPDPTTFGLALVVLAAATHQAL